MIWLGRPSDLRQGKKAKRKAFQALMGERVKAIASKQDAQRVFLPTPRSGLIQVKKRLKERLAKRLFSDDAERDKNGQ